MEEASRTAAAFEDKTTLWGAVASWFALELERSSLSVFVGETQLKEVCKVISEAFVDSIRKKGRKPLYFATRPSPYDDDVLPADKINSLLKKWGSVLEPSVVRNAILEARKGLSKAFSSGAYKLPIQSNQHQSAVSDLPPPIFRTVDKNEKRGSRPFPTITSRKVQAAR